MPDLDPRRSLQEMILALEIYWIERGCVIAQPYPSEVGAGTFNPATFLRSLGPEPWRLSPAEPAPPPKSGPFGANPTPVPPSYPKQRLLTPAPAAVPAPRIDS